MNEIYFKPALQTENTGDLLINKAEVELLQEFGKVIIDDSNTPRWFIDQIGSDHNLKLSNVSSASLFKSILRSLKTEKNKIIFLAIQPGHTSRTGLKAAFNFLKDSLKLFILKVYGCKIIRLGFSIGPFDFLNAILESLNTRSYYYYAVRDNESLKLAKAYKFKNPQYSPDLAWAYTPMEINGESAANSYYVLSFRSNSYGEIHNPVYLEQIKRELVSLLEQTLERSSKIVVSYQVKYDREASIELFNTIRTSFPNTTIIDSKLLLNDAVELYSNAKCVISNRLHVLLLAMQCGTLAIPFVYDVDNRKITSIYKDNDLASTVIYCDDHLEQKITNMNFILQNRDLIMLKFKELVSKNKEMIRINLKKVFTN